MNKMAKWLIASGVLLVSGVSLAMIGFSMEGSSYLKKASIDSDLKFESYDIDEEFRNLRIDIKNDNIVVRCSDNDDCRVECLIPDNVTYEITVEDDTLVIKSEDDREQIGYNPLFSNEDESSCIVYLPGYYYNSLEVRSVLSKIEIESGLTFDSIDIEAKTADITISGTTANDSIDISCDVANVTFDRCDAPDIEVFVDAGNIEGTLLTGKDFDVHVSVGNVDVPASQGNEICRLEISVGNVSIEVV